MYKPVFRIFGDFKVLSYTSSRQLKNLQYSTSSKPISYLRKNRKDISLAGWLLLVKIE